LHCGLSEFLVPRDPVTECKARIEDEADVVGVFIALAGRNQVPKMPGPLLETMVVGP
jgi:hypothetical protein